MKNAYFRLLHKEDGTYISLIPAQDGGEDLDINEIKEKWKCKMVHTRQKRNCWWHIPVSMNL